MIKYNLKCKNDHEFESWFSNSEEFEKLNKKNLIRVYLLFLKKNIKKSIMSPMVSGTKTKDEQINKFQKIF